MQLFVFVFLLKFCKALWFTFILGILSCYEIHFNFPKVLLGSSHYAQHTINTQFI